MDNFFTYSNKRFFFFYDSIRNKKKIFFLISKYIIFNGKNI